MVSNEGTCAAYYRYSGSDLSLIPDTIIKLNPPRGT